MERIKKIVLLLISAAMAVQAAPAVLAADLEPVTETVAETAAAPATEVATESELTAAVATSGEIKLTADITLTATCTISGEKIVTIDLNGHSITVSEDKTTVSALRADKGAVLTVKNGSVIGNYNGIFVTNAGTSVTIENCTVTGKTNAGISANSGVEVTVIDSAVSCTNTDVGEKLDKGNAIYSSGAILTLRGGSYTSVSDKRYGLYAVGTSANKGSITIEGGEFSSIDTCEGTIYPENIAITGGTKVTGNATLEADGASGIVSVTEMTAKSMNARGYTVTVTDCHTTGQLMASGGIVDNNGVVSHEGASAIVKNCTMGQLWLLGNCTVDGNRLDGSKKPDGGLRINENANVQWGHNTLSNVGFVVIGSPTGEYRKAPALTVMYEDQDADDDGIVDIKITNSNMIVYTSSCSAVITGPVDLILENCTLAGSVYTEYDSSSVTLNNCTSTHEYSAIARRGSVTINGGSYNCVANEWSMRDLTNTITVNDGTIALLAPTNQSGSKTVVNGGTINKVEPKYMELNPTDPINGFAIKGGTFKEATIDLGTYLDGAKFTTQADGSLVAEPASTSYEYSLSYNEAAQKALGEHEVPAELGDYGDTITVKELAVSGDIAHQKYAEGKVVTLTAEVGHFYKFDGWYKKGTNELLSSDTTYRHEITADSNIELRLTQLYEEVTPENGVYTVNNYKQLMYISYLSNIGKGHSFAGETVKLGDNIVMEGDVQFGKMTMYDLNGKKVDTESYYATEDNFFPICFARGNVFQGTFDGNGKKISNFISVSHGDLYASPQDTDQFRGLIGRLGSGTVKDFTTEVNMIDSWYSSIICEGGSGTITNLTTTAYGTFPNERGIDGNIRSTGNNDAGYAAGIMAHNYGYAYISNCHVHDITICGAWKTGGITGLGWGFDISDCSVKDCYISDATANNNTDKPANQAMMGAFVGHTGTWYKDANGELISRITNPVVDNVYVYKAYADNKQFAADETINKADTLDKINNYELYLVGSDYVTEGKTLILGDMSQCEVLDITSEVSNGTIYGASVRIVGQDAYIQNENAVGNSTENGEQTDNIRYITRLLCHGYDKSNIQKYGTWFVPAGIFKDTENVEWSAVKENADLLDVHYTYGADSTEKIEPDAPQAGNQTPSRIIDCTQTYSADVMQIPKHEEMLGISYMIFKDPQQYEGTADKSVTKFTVEKKLTVQENGNTNYTSVERHSSTENTEGGNAQ